MTTASSDEHRRTLKREFGVFGATMMGLGSIMGTGVFLSIGIASGAAGPAVVLAIAIAAAVALFNGLAALNLLQTILGAAELMNMVIVGYIRASALQQGGCSSALKISSAATAALGFSGYLLHAIGRSHSASLVPLALGAVLVLTVLVLSGIRHSRNSNILFVSITLFSLLFFVLAGLPTALTSGTAHMVPFFSPASDATSPIGGFLQACALMFVAYTGYGRIATLAEEVHTPRRTIPLAIIITLLVSMLLYVAVGLVSVACAGIDTFAMAGTQNAAPLEVVARDFDVPGVVRVIAIGAVTAMLGVLLNLILGLSRVVLAMARRRDIPLLFSRVGKLSGTPYLAVLFVGGMIAVLVMIGDVKDTWSFRAFTVLIYYAITNLAAIRMTDEERLYPKLIPWLGLCSCLFLAFWVETEIWLSGLVMITGGLIWHLIATRITQSPEDIS